MKDFCISYSMKKLDEQQITFMLTIMVLVFFVALIITSFVSRRYCMLKEDFTTSINPIEARKRFFQIWGQGHKRVSVRSGGGAGGIAGGYGLGSFVHTSSKPTHSPALAPYLSPPVNEPPVTTPSVQPNTVCPPGTELRRV